MLTFILSVFIRLVRLIIRIMQLLLVIQAVCSWFPDAYRLYDALNKWTELVVRPIRALLDHFDFGRNLPIDLAPLFTFILLSMVLWLL